MRSALVFATLVSLAGGALAEPSGPSFDPFAHRTANVAEPEAAPLSPALPASTDRVDDPGRPRRQAALGFLVAGLAFGTGAFALSSYERHEYDAALARPSGAPIDPIAARNANHARDMARYVATPMTFVGAAALGTALYLYVTAPKELVRHVVVTPTLYGGQAGVSLTGGF